jgi:hypothetical protein
MPKKFTVTHLFCLESAELPFEFSFDVPINGHFQFVQEDNDVFLYCEGDTTAVTTKVEGRLVIEGDEIPPEFTLHAILALLTEDELGWLTIHIKEVQPLIQRTVTSWKKKF